MCVTVLYCVSYFIKDKWNHVLFWVSIFKTIVDHWCTKSENHQKTIESNGLGAENQLMAMVE